MKRQTKIHYIPKLSCLYASCSIIQSHWCPRHTFTDWLAIPFSRR